MFSESILCCSEHSVSLENLEDMESPRSSNSVGDLDMGAASFSGSPLDGVAFRSISTLECRETLKVMSTKQLEFMPDVDKIRAQGGENVFDHRRKVITCMADICQKLDNNDSTFFSAVNILDRFLSVHSVKENQKVLFPLIGIACVSIATKMTEVSVPSLKSLQKFMGEGLPFNPSHIQGMEMGILNSLEWKMACITPCTVLCYVVKMLRDSYECISAEEAKVTYASSMSLMKKFVYDREYVEYSATEIAAASVLKASLSHQQEMCCHDLMMQLNGDRKRSHDGTLATLCECMTNMDSLGPVGPVYNPVYQNKRHISRSLSPTTPLGFYL